ncbi:MAG: hypothetical protein AB7H77_01270 [Bdellovibrionales bacterium]
MTIDITATAQGLANLLFVQPNATATLSGDELAQLAAAINAGMASAIGGFAAALPGTAAALSAPQLDRAMAFIAVKRAGLA